MAYYLNTMAVLVVVAIAMLATWFIARNEGYRAGLREQYEADTAKVMRGWQKGAITTNLNDLAALVHRANHKWWVSVEDGVTPLKRNKGELLALVHSEISEALEGERKGAMDDKLPHRRMAEVELADTVIRILDYSAGFGYDLQGAFSEKMAYNQTREDHTHEARKIAGGKQF